MAMSGRRADYAYTDPDYCNETDSRKQCRCENHMKLRRMSFPFNYDLLCPILR